MTLEPESQPLARDGGGVRLSAAEVAAINSAARAAFGDSVVVRLFGSRVHAHLRGGDIDLHFEVDPGRGSDAEVGDFEDLLFREIDEQRVDKVFSVRGEPRSPFEQIAYRDGVIL